MVARRIVALAVGSVFLIAILMSIFLPPPEPKTDVTLPRLVLAFYYPWYGTPQGPTGSWRHWQEGGHNPDEFLGQRRDIGAAHYPVHGPYDSKNRSLTASHFELAEEAGIDGFIVSWWGSDTFENEAFRLMLDVAEEIDTPVNLTIYYEECPGGKNETAMEIETILETYGRRGSFLKVEGYPVIFIYSRAFGQLTLEDWDYVLRNVRYDGYNASFIVDGSGPEVAKVFDGLHTYNPVWHLHRGENLTDIYVQLRGEAEEQGIIFAATVLPGYDDTHIGRENELVAPRDGGQTYSRTWEAALLSDPDWILICSWNEWHEGTEIEPSLEDRYLHLALTKYHAERFNQFIEED